MTALPLLNELELTFRQMDVLQSEEIRTRKSAYLPPTDPDVEELVGMGLLRPSSWRWCPSRRWRRFPNWKNGHFLLGPSAECRAILAGHRTPYPLTPSPQSTIHNPHLTSNPLLTPHSSLFPSP